LQQQVASFGIALPVIEAFRCEDDEKSYIIMPSINMNLVDFCLKLNSYREYVDVIPLIKGCIAQASNLLTTLHANGMVHGDSHLENFMFDPAKNYDVVLDWCRGDFVFNSKFSHSDADDSFVLFTVLEGVLQLNPLPFISQGCAATVKELSRTQERMNKWLGLDTLKLIDFGLTEKIGTSTRTPKDDLDQLVDDASEQPWGRYVV